MKEIVFGIMSFEDVCKGTRRRENRMKERTRSPLLYENDLECFCIRIPIKKETFPRFYVVVQFGVVQEQKYRNLLSGWDLSNTVTSN